MPARKHPLANCEECPLQKRPCAPTPPAHNPKVAIVSRSPGYYEAIAGKPFSGPSGKVLDHLLKMNGVSRSDCLVTNTVLCAHDGTEVPREAIKACAPRLAHELKNVSLVIACGREAVNELVGPGVIDRYRGFRIERDGKTFVATNNPALVLRDDSTYPNLKRDFQRAFKPLPEPTFPRIEVIEDASTACDLLDGIKPGLVAADIESRGGITHRATLISLQIANSEDVAFVLGERGGLWEDESFVRNHLRPFLESDRYQFIWHGGKFDTKILRHTYGIEARVDHDTLLLSYSLDERSGTDERIGVHGLEYLLMDNFGWPKYSSSVVDHVKKSGEFITPSQLRKLKGLYREGTPEFHDAVVRTIAKNYDEFYRYAGLDVGGTFQLFRKQLVDAEKDNVMRPYEHLLIPGNALLTKSELHGTVYDTQAAADIYEFEVGPEIENLTDEIREKLQKPLLKPSSPDQMAALFYDEWGLKHEMQKRPDKKRSVDKSARKEILEDRFDFRGSTVKKRQGTLIVSEPAPDAEEKKNFYVEVVKAYDRFQTITKQASTYLLGMIERAEADPEHRIYTTFNFHGTNSGRLSSSRPNLQNITRPKEGLPNIRNLFRASPGRLIVSADYSQAELRCIAQFSGDKDLQRIYLHDLDLHNETAKRFYGEGYTPEQRSICKNVNFGVFYRQSADTFQEKHGIPAEKAQPYIEWVWSTFLGVKQWEADIEKDIHSKGVLVSPFGRKRRFHLLTKENIQAAYREGINFYPQSTASDLTLASAIRLGHEIDWSRAAIIILVHDNIVGDVEESYVDTFRTITKEVMESCAKDELGWTLPFKADIGVGSTWGEAK